MEDIVFSERDIHGIVKILRTNSNITMNLDLLCGALELTPGEHAEISRHVDMKGAGPYLYLSLILSKWIELNSASATVRKLSMILREENFTSTADELLKILKCQPKPDTQNNVRATIVEQSEKIEPFPRPWNVNGIHKDNTVQSKSRESIKKLINLRGSQTELNELLKLDPKVFYTLRSIEFHNMEMSWENFWNSTEHLKSLELIRLTNLNLLDCSIPLRRKLLPNMRVYVIKLDISSSECFLRSFIQAREKREYIGDREHLFEVLIPFAKKNLDEEVWNTCLNLSHIELNLTIVSGDVIFKICNDKTEFVLDRMYVEYYQNSTRHSALVNFLQTFQELKVLYLTNFCGVVGDLDFSSIPSSLTEFTLIDVPTPIKGEQFDLAMKSLKCLISLNIGVPKVDFMNHRIDIACLSPELRYLTLENARIICSSPCQFKHMSLLTLNDSYFDSSVEVPFVFPSIKKCYFHALSTCVNPLSRGLKEWLEMDMLELIVMKGLTIYQGDGVLEILSTYDFPDDAESFALEKFEGEWGTVDISEESEQEIFKEVYTGGMYISKSR